jgi:transcriptional regulator with XRE-family HTH domain
VSPGELRELTIERIIDALRQARLRQGLSQNQVAQRAGLSHTMVLRVEKRERMPTIDTLLRIATALDVELGTIVTCACQITRRKEK